MRGLLRFQEHVEQDEVPNLNNTREQNKSRDFLSNSFFLFFFIRIKLSKCLLGDSLLDQSDANRIKRNTFWRSIIKNVPLRAFFYFILCCCPPSLFKYLPFSPIFLLLLLLLLLRKETCYWYWIVVPQLRCGDTYQALLPPPHCCSCLAF